ncbi:MAG: hypothetical protein WA952_03855 [Lewinella sp.]
MKSAVHLYANLPVRVIRILALVVFMLAVGRVSAQLRGPDVELSAGLMGPFSDQSGSGPKATISLNHGYLIYRRLYARVGLGVGYRKFVTNDTEDKYLDNERQLFRRHIELAQLHGRATAALGLEFGAWSFELGTAYLRMIWQDASLTTATYSYQGEELTEPYTQDLNFRMVVPGEYKGSYYYTVKANWMGNVSVNTRLTPHLALGLRYATNLGGASIVHTNEFTCEGSKPCERILRFTRDMPVSLGALTLSLRYRFGPTKSLKD